MNRALGTTDEVSQAIRYLPSCYTYDLARCLEEEVMTAHPRCQEFTRAGQLDYDRFQAALEKMPVCPTPSRWPLIAAVASAGVLGIACIVLAYR